MCRYWWWYARVNERFEATWWKKVGGRRQILTELNFFSRQDFFDLTKEMSSCTVQLLKNHFKSKRSSLEISRLNGVALASAHTPSATPDPGRTLRWGTAMSSRTRRVWSTITASWWDASWVMIDFSFKSFPMTLLIHSRVHNMCVYNILGFYCLCVGIGDGTRA